MPGSDDSATPFGAGLRPALREVFAPRKIPWTFLAIGLASAVIELNPGWRGRLVYDRGAVARGEWWRIWTGHLVHFGWPHFVADTGLFLILGRLLEWEYRWLVRAALVVMPALIVATVYVFQPSMVRYGGLSAVDLGLLVFLACRGWQKNWVDWFWPAVLAIYVGEIALEATVGHGHGGGMIRFDDSSVRVATVAHVGAAACGVAMWLIASTPRGPGRR